MDPLKRLYSSLWLAVAVNLVIGALLVVLEMAVIPASTWLPWYLFLLLVNMLRLFLAIGFWRYRQGIEEQTWRYWFLATVFINGLTWGSAGLLFFAPADPVHQAWLVLVLTGMAAGAVTSLSWSVAALFLFQLPLILPVVVRLLQEASTTSLALALMGVLLLLVVSGNGLRMSRALRDQQDLVHALQDQREQARAGEQRYQTLVDNLGDALYLHDRQGRFVDVNSRACEALGYSREELLALNVQDLEKSMDMTALDEVWEQLVAGENIRIEGMHRRRDGSTFPVEVTLCVVNDAEQPLYLAVVRDVTAARAVEQARHDSERRLRTLFEAVPVPTYAWQKTAQGFVLIDANAAARHHGHRPVEESIGRNAEALYADVPEVLQYLAECYDSRKEVERDIVVETADRPRYWSIRFVFVSPDQVLMHAEDITERKRNEHALALTRERLSEAQRIARLGYWTMEEGSDTMDWSSEVYNIFGLLRGKARSDLATLLQMVDERDRSALQRNLGLLQGQGRAPDLELRITRADDQHRVLLATAHSRHQMGHERPVYFGTFQDITDTKLQQRMLIEAKEQAEQANQAKSEFLSRMSHELRTPMNAILGFSQLMAMEGELDDKVRESVAEIIRAGNHLLELINEVLDLSHIESGRLNLHLQDISLENIIEECIIYITPIARKRDISISRHDTSFQDQPVFADSTRVRQVLLNLLSNAVKYNRHGGTITIECSTEASGFVRIAVSDTGKGIEADRLQQLFTPFNRLGEENSGIEGTGIGLVIARKLVELMNGRMEVSSTPAKGSVFSVFLPLSLGSEEYKDGSFINPYHERVERWQEVKVRIVYVEDNAANLRLLENILAQYEGVELLSAADGDNGLTLIQASVPDIVLLDINLPGMDGYGILRHLREDPATARIPVIAISALAREEDVATGLQAGFDGYLTKPLDVSALMQLLENLFARLPEGPPAKRPPRDPQRV